MAGVVKLGANEAAEILRRQVHPAHFKLGSTTDIERTAFTPRWKTDEPAGDMSHLRGSVSAEDAYARGQAANLTSAGTWGVSVGEALALALDVADDSALPGRPSDHAYVCLEEGRTGWKQLARELAAAASKRGCLFRP